MKKIIIAGVISGLLIITLLVYAAPTIDFVSPTLSNNSYTNKNWTCINITSTAYLNQSLLEWGNVSGFTNISMSNNSLTNWYKNMTNLSDYTYNYTVWAQNTSGNWSQSERRFVTVDTTPPTIDFTTNTPADDSNQTSTTVVVNVSITETNLDTITLDWNGTNETGFTETSSGNWNITKLSLEGTYTFQVFVNDTAGNSNATEQRTVSVDTTSPSVAINTPTNTTYGSASQVINATITDATLTVADVIAEINGSVNVTLVKDGTSDNYNATYTFSEGANNVKIYANDTLDNMNSAEIIYFTIDTTPPTITISSPGNATISDSTPDLNFTTNESTNITYNWDGEGNISGCISCTSFNTTYGENNGSDANLTALWHANENYGNIIFDETANNNDGTLKDYLPYSSDDGDTPPQWIDGKFGKALSFDGEDDYVDVPDSASLDITDELTIAAWIKPRDVDEPYQTIIEKTPDIYALYVNQDKTSMWVRTTSGSCGMDGMTSLAVDTWYFVVGIYDGAELRVYVNGASDASTSCTVPLTTSTKPLRIGGYSSDGFFNGIIDEIAIYDRALSATEISELYNKSLSDGAHYVTVYANDTGGNLNSSAQYFTVDTLPPYQIDLNYPTNNTITKNTSINFNWTSYDATSNMSSNLTIDGVVNNSDVISTYNGTPTNYTVSGFADGQHNWSITTWDAAGNSNTSSTIYFTVDATPPQYVEYNNTPFYDIKDNESVVIYSRWNDTGVGLDSAIIEENATGVFRNHTVRINESWGNYTITAADLEAGLIQCRVYANDTAGNWNSTPAWNFTVQDVTPPAITNITYLPNTTDGLDPNITINITANVTDFVNVSTVILQYKNETSPWINYTMNKTGDIYEGNFTPTTINNWTFRIWANDSSNNINITTNITLAIDDDWTWTRSPADFGAQSGILGTNITLGNLTINNTGDFNLSFDLSSDQSWIYFDTNASSASYDVNAGSVKYIQVNASVPSEKGEHEYPFEITINSTNVNATPNSLITNGTLIAYASGPYLYVTITAYDPAVMQGDTGVSLEAKVENMGNESATNAWLAWILPSGWTNTSGVLNVSGTLATSAPKNTLINSITVNISSSAATGTQTLQAVAGCAENKTGSRSVDVVVSSKAVAPPSPGGGPARVERIREVALPTYSPTPAERKLLFESIETIELVRGFDDTFRIKVTNPFPNSTLENVTISVEGYLPQYIKLTPGRIDRIGYNETKEFEVLIIAPIYLESTYYLNFTVAGKVSYYDYPLTISEVTGEALSYKNISLDMVEKRIVTLVVHKISRGEAIAALNLAEGYLGDMQKAGFFITRVSKLSDEAKKAMEQGDYERAKELSEQIAGQKESAFITHGLIQDLKNKINEAEERGLKVIETKELFDLVLAAFEREDYATAQQRIRDAQLVYSLETKGKISITKLILDYWHAIVLSIALISIAGAMLYRRLLVRMIARRLENLRREEANIIGLIREVQERYYKEKTISMSAYHKAVKGYEKRLADIQRTRAKLRAMRIGIIKISDALENLKKENLSLTELMKDTQDRYFRKGIMSRREYEKNMEQYRLRKAEIEEGIAVIEARLAKKERLEELKPRVEFKDRLERLLPSRGANPGKRLKK